ncbi:hypothetical protein ACHWQZ_G017016 [Mnemiopsis leidyi]
METSSDSVLSESCNMETDLEKMKEGLRLTLRDVMSEKRCTPTEIKVRTKEVIIMQSIALAEILPLWIQRNVNHCKKKKRKVLTLERRGILEEEVLRETQHETQELYRELDETTSRLAQSLSTLNARFTALENKMSWLNETCPSYTGISTWKLLLILLTVTLVFSAAVWLSKETEEGGEVCLGYHGNGDSC